ncbi:MAG TPA: ATP-binding cassette domain-containing protein [Myxococcales bacterium]|nr:ATP-binding cassette domain-containing protein [Myxococcales bacterium]
MGYEVRVPGPLIEFEDVTVLRDRSTALDGLTLRIDDGERVAILGPNGSGKSTLVEALTREVYPLSGRPGSRLRIYGRDTWNLFELRSLLGIVTNELVRTLTRRHSAYETALSGFFGSVGVWPHHEVTAEMERRASAALELLEVAHLAERPLVEMSSGEARRAVIARALVHQPRALVLDEPTNSLDVRGRRELRSAMSRLAQSGVSLVLVTHQLEDLVPEIDRIVTLRRGRVLHDGTKQEILRPEVLEEVFGTEVELREIDGVHLLW